MKNDYRPNAFLTRETTATRSSFPSTRNALSAA